jgi:hypothetical protein
VPRSQEVVEKPSVESLERAVFRHEDRINGLHGEISQMTAMLRFLCEEVKKISGELEQLPCGREMDRLTRLETRLDAVAWSVRLLLGGGGVAGFLAGILVLIRSLRG